MASFLFDNDISFRIAAALRELDPRNDIWAMREKVPPDTPDVEWIPQAGNQGLVVLSRDHNQRRRDAEHAALINAGLRVLYIRYSGQQLELYSDAARIIKNWPKIQQWATIAPPGTLSRLTTKDTIESLPSKRS